MTLEKGHNFTKGDNLDLKNMGQLFLMTNLFRKFQNCNLIFVMDAQRDGRKDGQAQRNMLSTSSKLGA